MRPFANSIQDARPAEVCAIGSGPEAGRNAHDGPRAPLAQDVGVAGPEYAAVARSRASALH